MIFHRDSVKTRKKEKALGPVSRLLLETVHSKIDVIKGVRVVCFVGFRGLLGFGKVLGQFCLRALS